MTMLQAYKQETATHHSNVYDSWGERTETDTVIPVRATRERKRVKDAKGEYVISELQLHIRKDITVEFDDMFTFDGKKSPIITIKKPRAFINAYGHTEVYL